MTRISQGHGIIFTLMAVGQCGLLSSVFAHRATEPTAAKRDDAARHKARAVIVHRRSTEIVTAPQPLLRGPVHEAFAQPAVLDCAAPLAVDGHPPTPLAEYPPAVRPARADSVWLPGYWAWEPADERFVWLSGIWRVPPPGIRWSPGYWSDAGDHSMWVAGFWYPRDRAQLRYLPDPPHEPGDDERGVAPADDFFYVPGYWVFTGGEYVWKAGHWSPGHASWVWMPTRALSTPAGSLLVPGYWDYSLVKRGLLFAPMAPGEDGGADDVADNAARSKRLPAVVTPRVAIDVRRLSEYLFIDPASRHYCFGDYFANPPAKSAMIPWYDFAGGSDPLFVYERWTRGRVRPEWEAALRGRYEQRARQAELRPPTTWSDRQMVTDGAAARGGIAGSATSPGITLVALARDRSAPLRLTTVTAEGLPQAANLAEHYKLLANQRKKFESDAGGPPADGQTRALVLTAPPDPPPVEAAPHPTSGVTGAYLPGVKGREVPGLSGRTLPGMAGRSVPGVDTTAPGVVGPGVSPGADTRGETPQPRAPAVRAPARPR
jgi:hypothetical protein